VQKFFVVIIAFALLAVFHVHAAPFISLPKAGITANEIAVVYIKGDNLSEKIARYYVQERRIPEKNLVAIKFDASQPVVNPGHFAVQKRAIDAQLGEHIQAYALSWQQPYRVGCMGMTAAFAFGFNSAYCAQGCNSTKLSPYYHSASLAPYNDFSMRPAMMLAAENFEAGKALIDRGIRADDTQPLGRAFLLQTNDKTRSVRQSYAGPLKKSFGRVVEVNVLEQNSIKNRADVLFYFTGAKHVEHIETLSYLPGAMADHLTSAGGVLTGSSQMSAVRWLEAGATGSYGTAVEPCNLLEKFPNPLIAIWHYLRGATLIEAYWKSVAMPGQGNFIGEPLAAPYRGYRLRKSSSALQLHSPLLRAGFYRVTPVLPGFDGNGDVQRVTAKRPYINIYPPFNQHYSVSRK